MNIGFLDNPNVIIVRHEEYLNIHTDFLLVDHSQKLGDWER